MRVSPTASRTQRTCGATSTPNRTSTRTRSSSQDSFTWNRVTLNVGVRLDHQDDRAVAATVPANPLIPAQLPAIDFPGADAGVAWSNLSPRSG